ncbi:MAG: hypothetical protein U0872_08665 [Planctomycetaceae bacterium]
MDEPQLSLESGLETLDFVAIIGYLLLTFGIAVWFGSRQKNTEDFFVGGRSMPWFAVGLSILATLFSTLSYLGMPGEAIKNGFGVALGILASPLSMAVVMFLWIPFFMRLRLTSAYEYLERRVQLRRPLDRSRIVHSAPTRLDEHGDSLLRCCLIAKGLDLDWLPGPDLYWWIGLIGVVAAVYTAVGGIEAMIWTDVLQCLLLLIGIFLTIGYVMIVDGTGPMDWWRTAALTEGRNNLPPLFSLDPTVRSDDRAGKSTTFSGPSAPTVRIKSCCSDIFDLRP